MKRRRRSALVAGLAISGLYALLAAFSGSLTPLARGPLLDGLGPVNYRWVAPPPELASTNQEPSSGTFTLQLGAEGVKGQVLFTSDNQVTVIVPGGSIRAAAGQRTVELSVVPVDPATLPPPGQGRTVFGNGYAISATYQPSGKRVARLQGPIDVILVYPATSTLHATSHDMLYTADGQIWETLEGTESLQQQQSEAGVPGFGTVLVAGVVTASPTTAPAEADRTTLGIVLLVLAGCALLVGIGLLLRSRAPRGAR